MINFRQTNQQFRTIDLMGMLILFGIVTSSIGALLAEAIHDTRPTRAKAAAEAYALQLKIQHEKTRQAVQTGERLPASVPTTQGLLRSGTIGRDPWGQPFRYKVQNTSEQDTQQIIVWSDGPDRKPDTLPLLEKVAAAAAAKNFRFQGDDIGFIQDAAFLP